MLIRDLLKEKPLTFSCELFPPKAGTELDHAYEVVAATAKFQPDFISVTYGAGGGNAENAFQVAKCVKDNGINALAHLTCVGSSKEDIHAILKNLQQAGIDNILALRGDLPAGQEAPKHNQFQHAIDLMQEIKAFGGFSIGGACYPEGHVESISRKEDICYLKRKVEAGCDFLTTQMFFDNNILYRFLYRLLAKGVDIPVLAGIMPVTNKKQIKRIVALSGTQLPNRFHNILDRFGDDPLAMEQAGIAYATEQIIDLIANGVRGIHLYTMNRPDIAGQIVSNLSHILKAE